MGPSRNSWRSVPQSGQRSPALGIDPDQHRPVHRHDVSEARSLSAGHRLATVMPALSQLLADESSAARLVRTHHDWACTAAPIRDPYTGDVVGVLDVPAPSNR